MERETSEQRLCSRGASGRTAPEAEPTLAVRSRSARAHGRDPKVTDESRPGNGKPGAEERDDALASWFRPQPEAERQPEPQPEPEPQREAGAEEREQSAGAARGGSEQALTEALPVPDGDRTQVVPRPSSSSSSPSSASSPAARADEGGEGDGGAGADAEGADGVDVDRAAETDATSSSPKPADSGSPDTGSANDRTQLIPQLPPVPPRSAPASAPASTPAAAAPTQAIPRATAPLPPPLHPKTTPLPPPLPEGGMAVRGSAPRSAQNYGGGLNWGPEQRQQQQYANQRAAAPGRPPILPVRGYGDGDDDFDEYQYAGPERPGRRRRALLVALGIGVLIAGVAAGLVFSGTISVPGISAKPVPTVGFSPSGSDAGSDATQTGTAFLTAWQNGSLKAAANITDNPATALAQLSAYKTDLKLSGLTLSPGTATTGGWMTFNVTAQVGAPASAWSYSSGLAAYSSAVDGYTRWFVKWQPSLLFTSLKSGQKLGLGAIPATANKVVDRKGAEITSANAPSLAGIVKALKQNAPTSDGTPGQVVQIEKADGTLVSKVAKVSDPVNTSAVKTTIDLTVQKAAQSAVGAKSNSSMVVVQPSTGDILAVANNPSGGLDTAMLGRYAPGSTFKTITTALVLNKGVISNLNQTWDCPGSYSADGITLHNSEQEAGLGRSFLWDFSQSCNNAFSRFNTKISRGDLVATAHDYFGFNQKWDVGLGQPTTYGNVPNTSANSLAEELVGQDRITTSPLAMASVAATVANCGFKQPILAPGTAQLSATALPASTCSNLKTLMHAVVTNGTLAGVFNGQPGVYAKTGTAEVQGRTPNSWTIAFKGDYAVAALAVGGNFGAQTAGPEVKSLLNAVS
jgi:hypothetical protein